MQSTDTIAYHPLWQVDVYRHGIGLWFYVCGIVIWKIWEFQSKNTVEECLFYVLCFESLFLNINSYQLDYEFVVEPNSVSYPMHRKCWKTSAPGNVALRSLSSYFDFMYGQDGLNESKSKWWGQSSCPRHPNTSWEGVLGIFWGGPNAFSAGVWMSKDGERHSNRNPVCWFDAQFFGLVSLMLVVQRP